MRNPWLALTLFRVTIRVIIRIRIIHSPEFYISGDRSSNFLCVQTDREHKAEKDGCKFVLNLFLRFIVYRIK